jgi:uncharacterized protein GlcG (DUF336 family)
MIGEFKMKKIVSLVAVASMSMASASAMANDCPVSHAELQAALDAAVAVSNGGLDYDMWGTVVNRDGAVCAVVKADGLDADATVDPWPGSRAISAQKANTANSYSNANLSLSTANLYSAVQPGGSLYGLQHSNPVDPRVAYRGDSSTYGSTSDPMNGLKVGGVNVFGGGLALYDATGQVVGAVGVSGDTSCADHNVAMRTREALAGGAYALANIPAGVDGESTDNITFDDNIGGGLEAAFNQPLCGFGEPAVNDAIMTSLGVAGFTPAP